MKLSTHIGRGLNGFIGWFLITSLYWGPILFLLAGTEGAMFFMLCAIIPFGLLLSFLVVFLWRRRYADIVGMLSAFCLNAFAWVIYLFIILRFPPHIFYLLIPGLGGIPFYFFRMLR